MYNIIDDVVREIVLEEIDLLSKEVFSKLKNKGISTTLSKVKKKVEIKLLNANSNTEKTIEAEIVSESPIQSNNVEVEFSDYEEPVTNDEFKEYDVKFFMAPVPKRNNAKRRSSKIRISIIPNNDNKPYSAVLMDLYRDGKRLETNDSDYKLISKRLENTKELYGKASLKVRSSHIKAVRGDLIIENVSNTNIVGNINSFLFHKNDLKDDPVFLKEGFPYLKGEPDKTGGRISEYAHAKIFPKLTWINKDGEKGDKDFEDDQLKKHDCKSTREISNGLRIDLRDVKNNTYSDYYYLYDILELEQQDSFKVTLFGWATKEEVINFISNKKPQLLSQRYYVMPRSLLHKETLNV